MKKAMPPVHRNQELVTSAPMAAMLSGRRSRTPALGGTCGLGKALVSYSMSDVTNVATCFSSSAHLSPADSGFLLLQ